MQLSAPTNVTLQYETDHWKAEAEATKEELDAVLRRLNEPATLKALAEALGGGAKASGDDAVVAALAVELRKATTLAIKDVKRRRLDSSDAGKGTISAVAASAERLRQSVGSVTALGHVGEHSGSGSTGSSADSGSGVGTGSSAGSSEGSASQVVARAANAVAGSSIMQSADGGATSGISSRKPLPRGGLM